MRLPLFPVEKALPRLNPKLLTIAGLVGAIALHATTASVALAQKPEDAVMKVINTLFEGMKKKDTAMMRSTLAPNVRLTATRSSAPFTQDIAIDRWLSSVANAPAVLDERLFNPEVRVSDNLASVWVRFELWVGQTFSHCGYDAFQLARFADGWKIVQIADTQRRDRATCTS